MKNGDLCSTLNRWAFDAFQSTDSVVFSFSNDSDIFINRFSYDGYTPEKWRVIYKDGKVDVKSVRVPEKVSELKLVIKRLRRFDGYYVSPSCFADIMHCVIYGNDNDVEFLLSRFHKGRL